MTDLECPLPAQPSQVPASATSRFPGLTSVAVRCGKCPSGRARWHHHSVSPAERSASALVLSSRVSSSLRFPWVGVLLIYLASRLYSSVLLVGMVSTAEWQGWSFIGIRGRPGFVIFSGSWDGWFYRSIAEHGYPHDIPVDALGHVVPNPWAFLPVFPLLERVVTTVTGCTTFAAGAAVASAAGAAAAVALHRLLHERIGDTRALWAVALFCFGPLGFLLQVAYAESVFLLLVFIALHLMQRQRYLLLIPVVVLAAFTRPGAVALPAALALQVAIHWVIRRRPPDRIVRIVIALIVMTAACLAWPFIAEAATERHGAYLDTELSWWTGWVGRPSFIPFTPWFLITSRWLGPAGVLAAVALFAALLGWIVRGAPRSLPAAVRSFSVMHLLYLVAVFLPQFSLPRLLMPLSPLLGADTFTGTRRRA